MEFEREEEQNEQVKQLPKYMDTILKLVSKIEASIKSGKIQTALDHTDQKIVQDYTFFIEQVCLMMLEGDQGEYVDVVLPKCKSLAKAEDDPLYLVRTIHEV